MWAAKRRTRGSTALGLLFLVDMLLLACSAPAQDHYAIEVYGSETLAGGETQVELHSNFTFDGNSVPLEGVDPSEHALHETVEIAHGFADWFETGFYTLTSAKSGHGFQYVGNHIRPRVRVPEKWHWPIGLSFSAEIGYQRARFSPDTWTVELAPIIDKSAGKWYFAFNPTFDRSLHGPNTKNGFEFSPNAKVNRAVFRHARAGVECYSGYGPIRDFDPLHQQLHLLVPTLDLEFPGTWEMNVGYGFGLTGGTSEQIPKLVVGRRWGGKSREKD
jgi:hypothetical protein